MGAVLETVPQIAISAVESANLRDVVVRNYPREFAVCKQGGDMCVVRVFVVVCIKTAFALHVVRRVKVDEGLRWKPGNEAFEEGFRVEIGEGDPVAVGSNGLDAADESFSVESCVELPFSFLGDPADDSSAVYDSGAVCPIEIKRRKSKLEEAGFAWACLHRTLSPPCGYRERRGFDAMAECICVVKDAVPKSEDGTVEVVEVNV